MAKQEIKIKVEYTPGYEKRFTEAVLKRLAKKPQSRRAAADPAETTDRDGRK